MSFIQTNTSVTVTGKVATTPRSLTTKTGTLLYSFRLYCAGPSSTHDDNWFTVIMKDAIAERAIKDISKGDTLTVIGNINIMQLEDAWTGVLFEVEASDFNVDIPSTDKDK